MSAVWLNRLILWCSLAGMILTTHLWVQQARGFDQGCLGLSSSLSPALYTGGCVEERLRAAGSLFGISHAAWGYVFYFGLSLLSFFKLLAAPRPARWLHRVSEVAVLAAALQTGYLLYVMAWVAGAFCMLCLGSSLLVGLLLGAHLLLRRQGGFVPVEGPRRVSELGMAGGSLFAAVGLLLGLMLFVNRVGIRPLDQGASGEEIHRLIGQALPRYIDKEHLLEVRACRLEHSDRPLRIDALLPLEMPFLGAEDGIPVVVFYDPNCGHCSHFHRGFRRLMESHGDRAKFYVIPHRLWEISAHQVNALLLASQEGHYFALWEYFLDRQEADGTGLSPEQIVDAFEAVGLESAGLETRLAKMRPYADGMGSLNRTAGVRGTPTIFVDGLRVAVYNQSAECVEKLIERRLRFRERSVPGGD